MARPISEEARFADAELRAMQKRTRGATRGAAGAEDKVRMPVRTEACGGVRCVVVALPLPPRELNPNTQINWRVKAPFVAQAREMAGMVAVASMGGPGPGWERCRATVQITYANRRRRDTSNDFAACKHYWDGLTDAKIWKDDQHIEWVLPPARVEKGAAGVQITIEEVA